MTGAKAIIGWTGKVVGGWVSGGCAESTVHEAALECIASERPTILALDMNDEVLGTGMPCGGSMRVFVEPILPKLGLWIMGRGRIAECLCEMGSKLEFEVVVIDADLDSARFPVAACLITDDLDYSQLAPAPTDFVVVATQHKGDHHSIQRAMQLDVRYIGLIASRKWARLVLDYLHDEVNTSDELSHIFAPTGLTLGARTPEEIALSIVSEIAMVRRGGAGLHRRDELWPDCIQAGCAKVQHTRVEPVTLHRPA